MESANSVPKALTKKSKTNFYYSFLILPKEQKEALFVLYAFCRTLDDIVDENNDSAEKKVEQLNFLRDEIENCYQGKAKYPATTALSAQIKSFNLTKQYFFELINGVEMDIKYERYSNFSELVKYCYGVASTVGLLCMEIFGRREDRFKEYAINLGLSLQLTNILRDIKSDAKRCRIYIPLDEMKQFSYSEQDLFNEIYNESFIKLMDFQLTRARTYYKKTIQLLSKKERYSVVSAEIMGKTYYNILEKIELRNYNIFNEKITLSGFKKAAIALQCYLGFLPKL